MSVDTAKRPQGGKITPPTPLGTTDLEACSPEAHSGQGPSGQGVPGCGQEGARLWVDTSPWQGRILALWVGAGPHPPAACLGPRE